MALEIVYASCNFSKALTLVEDINTITVTAKDLAGKITTVTRTVILDTVAPTVNSIIIAPNPVNVEQSCVIIVDVKD